jgi:hypothetical protein
MHDGSISRMHITACLAASRLPNPRPLPVLRQFVRTGSSQERSGSGDIDAVPRVAQDELDVCSYYFE